MVDAADSKSAAARHAGSSPASGTSYSKLYRVKDARGLFVDVRPTGGRHFRIAYRASRGKVQIKTLGNSLL